VERTRELSPVIYSVQDAENKFNQRHKIHTSPLPKLLDLKKELHKDWLEKKYP
jgi:hypothetical protein